MNNSMNNNGMQNQNTNGNPQQQQINLQNIPPQQLAQLVTAMRTAYDQAKNSTNDSERQQHFNRAENIRRLLARYQAQKNRLQQQAQQQLAQQQQQQQLLQQQVQQQQQQKQQQTLTEHQQQIQAVQAQAQALAQMNNVNNNFNQMNNVNSNQVGTPLMQLQSPNPSLQSPMIQSRQVNMGTPMRQQSPLMQQQSPNMSQFSTQQLQGTPQPQQTPQPNNMFGNMNQTASSNMNAGTMNRNPLANNITMERLAQVKQKLTEVQQKVQLLEQSKKSNNITPEQIQMIDKEILENKTKFQQYQKVGMYIRSQLVLQAKAQRQKQLEQQQLQQNNNHGLLHQQPPQQMQNNQQQQQQQQQQLQSQIQQGQAQINQQRKFSPQLQAAQQQQQSQQQQQFLNNQQRTQSNNNMMQMQSQAPTPMPVRLTPQMQHNPVPSNMPSQAPTPAFPASQPTPSINGPASVPPPVSAPIQQQQPPPPPPQQQQQQQEQPHPQPHPQPQPHQRVPSRQASATPQAHFQQQQQIDKSHLPTNTAQEKVNQQRQSTASTSAHGTPAQNNGATITKSPSVANVASGTAARTVSGDASGPATGRGTPQQRPRSSMSLNLAGITRQPVPSIPINNSINVKPPTVTTFNSAHDGRPTLTGGAANSLSILLDSPAITKLPTFDIEGDTSSIDANTTGRVFNKRKLSDLISTIGVDEGDGKTNIDGNVEELLLDLADEFIHSVTSFACRLAKHRKVDSIEAKDIQLHLDKNWNIKIPGYAMDEIRSTRKVQPSNSYNQKVQGVEVSKAVNDDISNA